MDECKRFIENLKNRVCELEKKAALANWNFQTTGKKEYGEEAAGLGIELARIFRDKKVYDSLSAFVESDGLEPLLARQVEILYKQSKSLQVPMELVEKEIFLGKEVESHFNNFRAQVGDKKLSENEILKVLHTCESSEERRVTWEASKELGKIVEAKIFELVELRNRSATILGYENYYLMHLDLDEIPEKRLFLILDELFEKTEEYYSSFLSGLQENLCKRFSITKDEIRSWHLEDPFFQTPPSVGQLDLDPFFKGKDIVALTRKFFDLMGLEIGDILDRSDLYERPGKCQHAFCMTLKRCEDIRVLVNVKDIARWMECMLHEFGHAVYDKYINAGLPYFLKRPCHILFTEAVAMLMGRQNKKQSFLQNIAKIPANELGTHDEKIGELIRAQQIVFARWCMVVCHFERELYRDPGQDLNSLWWDFVERFQGIKRPSGRDHPDWASKIHLACAPVYYHNYVLGELLASQFLHAITENVFANTGNKVLWQQEVGIFLKEKIFIPGSSRNWEDSLVFATGEPLNPEYFVKDFVG
ncbi:M2 family metallopeptidase [Candidatus Riflebacteria bacterium]